MRLNLLMVFTTNVIVWAVFLITTISTGFSAVFFYAACGSMFGLWMLCSSPLSLIGEKHPAKESMLNHLIYVVAWLPIMTMRAHRALYDTLHIPNEILMKFTEDPVDDDYDD